jgi:DNA-binding NarL/FixJ family response regulator
MSACDHAVAIVDISLDGDTGLDLIKTLRRRYPDLAILTLSMHDESLFAERALRSGANGYLMKQEGTRNILQAVQKVLAGQIYLSAALQGMLMHRLVAPQVSEHSLIAGLSAREFEVLHLIGQGFGTRQIAEKLNRSVKTIEAHRANLKDKLQLASGTELLSFAIRWLDSN